MQLLDGPVDQRFQVLLTSALKEAATKTAKARKISLGKLIRRSLAADVDRHTVHLETRANGGVHPSHRMGDWHQTLRNDRFAKQRECRQCGCDQYETVAGDGVHPELARRCLN